MVPSLNGIVGTVLGILILILLALYESVSGVKNIARGRRPRLLHGLVVWVRA